MRAHTFHTRARSHKRRTQIADIRTTLDINLSDDHVAILLHLGNGRGSSHYPKMPFFRARGSGMTKVETYRYDVWEVLYRDLRHPSNGPPTCGGCSNNCYPQNAAQPVSRTQVKKQINTKKKDVKEKKRLNNTGTTAQPPTKVLYSKRGCCNPIYPPKEKININGKVSTIRFCESGCGHGMDLIVKGPYAGSLLAVSADNGDDGIYPILLKGWDVLQFVLESDQPPLSGSWGDRLDARRRRRIPWVPKGHWRG
eukprot:TRINITY_DN2537_c0_g1_i3.p1 TRINITY_DN2537_c0_g1~~TRINITY_DN2537_c0_g1_i3.p1  ORF type:complete len:253 (-),score=30.02 TRINITY_DN2537_c0_g1_i3:308-1066(-)